jgi:hypothetical protein
VILPSECRALGEGAITAYSKRLRFDSAGPSRTRIHDLLFAKLEHTTIGSGNRFPLIERLYIYSACLGILKLYVY